MIDYQPNKVTLPLRSIPSESSISFDVRNFGRPVVVIRIPNYIANEMLDGLVWMTDDEIEAIVAWWMLNKDHRGTVHQRDFFLEENRKNLKLPVVLSPSAVLRAEARRSQTACSDRGSDSLKESSSLVSEALSETRERRNCRDHRK